LEDGLDFAGCKRKVTTRMTDTHVFHKSLAAGTSPAVLGK